MTNTRSLITQISKLSTLCIGLAFMLGLSAPILFSEKLNTDLNPPEFKYLIAFLGLFVFTVVFFVWIRILFYKLKKNFENEI